MPLIHRESEKINIVVRFSDSEKGLEFHDDKYSGECVSETFRFHRQTWDSHKEIMSNAMIMNVQGQAIVDLFKLMDMKIRTQLAEWSLKDEKGDPLPVTQENIGKLDPNLVQHLFSKLQDIEKMPTE